VIGLSWRGLRQRAVSLVGAFVALALGVALTTASGVVLRASSRESGLDTASAAALAQAATLLVMLAVIGAFVTMFIVASTFAFSVAQRRRELARLRLVGATPGQVSRLVLVEAATVAAAAGIAGGYSGLRRCPRWCGRCRRSTWCPPARTFRYRPAHWSARRWSPRRRGVWWPSRVPRPPPAVPPRWPPAKRCGTR
jgi:FtsX-like permease family